MLDVIKAQLTQVFDDHEVWEISISSRPQIIDEIALIIKRIEETAYDAGYAAGEESVRSRLSFDEAEALGFDGTLRDEPKPHAHPAFEPDNCPACGTQTKITF
jgi:hypothetical protein